MISNKNVTLSPSEIEDNLQEVLAPLTMMIDMSICQKANSEMTIHADEFVTVLIGMQKKLLEIKDNVYK